MRERLVSAWVVLLLSGAAVLLLEAAAWRGFRAPPATTSVAVPWRGAALLPPMVAIASADGVLLVYYDHALVLGRDLRIRRVRWPCGLRIDVIRQAAASGRTLALAIPGAVVFIAGEEISQVILPGGHVLGVRARRAGGFSVYLDRSPPAAKVPEIGAVDFSSSGEIISRRDGLAQSLGGLSAGVEQADTRRASFWEIRAVAAPPRANRIVWCNGEPLFGIDADDRRFVAISFDDSNVYQDGYRGGSSYCFRARRCISRFYCDLPNVQHVVATVSPQRWDADGQLVLDEPDQPRWMRRYHAISPGVFAAAVRTESDGDTIRISSTGSIWSVRLGTEPRRPLATAASQAAAAPYPIGDGWLLFAPGFHPQAVLLDADGHRIDAGDGRLATWCAAVGIAPANLPLLPALLVLAVAAAARAIVAIRRTRYRGPACALRHPDPMLDHFSDAANVVCARERRVLAPIMVAQLAGLLWMLALLEP